MEYKTTLQGITSACFAFFLLTIMLGMSKLLTGQHHFIEIVFYRNALPACLLGGFILLTKRFDLLKPQKPRLLALRVLIGSLGLMTTFAAVQALPMSTATVLFFTSTMIIPIMAHFFLKEHIGLHKWIAVGIGMSAVILIARPSPDVTITGIVLALIAAFSHATIQILLRALKSENPLMVTFYFLLGGALISSLFMPFLATTPTLNSFLILCGIAATGGTAQYFLTTAFKKVPASIINPFNYTGLIWASGFDILVFNFVPGWNVYAGAAMIISAQIYILWREKRNAPP